jgi:hypothetical protein
MRESIFNGIKFGAVGLFLSALMLFGLNAMDISRETLIGILGSICGLLSIIIFLFGILLWVNRKIQFPVFMKTFFSMSLVLGVISGWNLVNAGWLSWTY